MLPLISQSIFISGNFSHRRKEEERNRKKQPQTKNGTHRHSQNTNKHNTIVQYLHIHLWNLVMLDTNTAPIQFHKNAKFLITSVMIHTSYPTVSLFYNFQYFFKISRYFFSVDLMHPPYLVSTVGNCNCFYRQNFKQYQKMTEMNVPPLRRTSCPQASISLHFPCTIHKSTPLY